MKRAESSAARLDAKQATDTNAIPRFQAVLDVRDRRFNASLLAFAIATGTLLATIALGQSAREVHDASPYVSIKDEAD